MSYLSRNIIIDNYKLLFRKIKKDILLNTSGIIRNTTGLNIATPERAFLDLLYLNKAFYFDNIGVLNKTVIDKLVPLYNSKSLDLKIKKVFANARPK